MKNEANVRVKIYNQFLYNPAYLAAKEFFRPPLYIQIQNGIHYAVSSSTSSLVLDKLIHDMFLICSMVQSGISKIYTHGISVNATGADIANVYMEFDNGDIASFIINKTSYKNVYEVSFFQKQSHINIDLLNKSGWVKTIYEGDHALLKKHDSMFLKTNNKINNPRIQEFKHFLYAIHSSNPLFDLERNRLVLEKSFAIDNKLNRYILV
jgi:predicted dehydrogenase